MNKMKGKNRHPNSNVESESDESNHPPNLDLSLMRQPIATSVTGFEEVLRAYEAGTNELRKLLSRECDLIYECKVCRNIFRSLTNFISHKRVYCRSSFSASDHFHFRDNGFQVQDISTIIQAEQEINNNPNGAAGILPGTDDKSKDLSGIVERLLWKQHQSRTSNLNDFYDQIHTSKKTDESSSHKSHTLKLNRVNDSDIAVYQSLQVDNENSNMKDEVSEVHKMLSKSNTVLGPDGKVLNLFNSAMEGNGSPAPSAEDLDNVSLTCQVCNLQFETEKTLKLHLELKHLPSTYVYQCPSCPQKFSSSAAVIKHLSNDHKKNNRRIRLMRDNIIKKRMRADEVVTKVPSISRELQKLQQTNNGSTEQTQEESTAWHTNDLSGDYQSDSSYTCPSCFKKFDRKAVYTNHVQACSDAKCREKSKLKKLKAKEETKSKQLQMEIEETSSEQSIQELLPPVPSTSTSASTSTSTSTSLSTSPEVDVNVNKRKRKRTSKVKKEEVEVKLEIQNEESNSVDWNLDDEEEKKKLENIKKEIIEDSYKRESGSANDNVNDSTASEVKAQESEAHDDDDDDSALVIDEKSPEVEGDSTNQFNCQQCDKVFDTDEKLKYHLNTYHSRQKRFKCKKCEYQGYRKKDTINHLNYVHNIDGDKETLESYMESVMKAVDEESLAKQNELKKNQLKIKRKMAREKLKMNGSKDESAAKESEPVTEPPKEDENTEMEQADVKVEFKEPAPIAESTPFKSPKMRRKSLHTSILIPPETDSTDDVMKIPKMFIKTKIEGSDGEEKKRKRKKIFKVPDVQPGQSLLNISKFGKIVKRSSTGDIKEGSTARPIRNRIKPVRQDFLYDLSDLLKKDADAYREQVIQSTTVGCKRELRKRTMSTHTREIPGLSSFDEPLSPKMPDSMLGPPPSPAKDEDDIPLMKFKDQRHRRMSVFQPPSRPMYPTMPRSPVYKPPAVPTSSSPNAGAAYKMALREFNASRASLYEAKFLWSICFDQEPRKAPIPTPPLIVQPTTSAAASILQKLTGKLDESLLGFTSSISKSKSVEERSTSSLTAEQLCKNFDMINVTSISENELDIPEARAINLNPGRNGLIALALEEAEKDGTDLCVLQECSPESSDEEDEREKPSSSSTVSDVEPKKVRKKRGNGGDLKMRRSRKNAEKRKSNANNQRRLTVMQRLQENKIRKSREQLFKRLIMDRQNDDENPSVSPVYNLFSES